jgi:O-antigen/teichoic acid export membrane protein
VFKYLSKNNWLLVFSVIIKFASVAVSILIIRWQNIYFSPDLLKDFNITLGYLAIILGIVTLGIPQILYKLYTNELDQNKLNDIWTTFFVLRILSYFLGVIIIVITLSFSTVNNLFLVVGVFTMQFILLADQSYRSVVDTRDKSYTFSSTDLLGKILLVLILYFVAGPLGQASETLNLFIYGSIAVYLSMYIFDAIINYKYANFTTFKLEIIKQHLSSLWYLTLPGLFVVSGLDRVFLEYSNVDKFALIGYANALKITEAVLVVPAIIVPSIASRLKRFADTNNSTEIGKQNKRYILVLGIIALSYSIAINVFSPFVLKFIDPNKLYIEYSLQIIPIFSLYIFLIFFNLFHQQINIFQHKEKTELKLHIFSNLIFLLVCVLFIPIIGIVGAAGAYFLSAFLNFLTRVIFLNHKKL